MDSFERSLVDLLPRLRRLARALTGHAADADDLCQVTVERALARRSQWAEGTRLDSWTMRILKNAWIDEARTRTRRPVSAFEPEVVEAVADPTAPAPELRDDALAISQAMGRLPDEQRLAISLVLVEGLSYAEAAEVLEIPQGTLTSRLARGRMALMAELEVGA